MNDYLSHSSKLIKIEELRGLLLPILNEESRKKISEQVDSLEQQWQLLGDKISEKEAEMKWLSAEVVNVVELIDECNERLKASESELNDISVETIVDSSAFEVIQQQINVSYQT